MATKLKDALAKKRTQKTILTKLNTKLSEPDLRINDLELLKIKFNKLQSEFDSIFESAIGLSTEESVEKLLNEQDEINSNLIDAEFELNDRLSKIAKENRLENPSAVGSENSVVRLPKISLPSFSGEMHSWLSFKDIFKASIDQNPNLSEAIKLQYLKSALKGDAFRIIQTISITDSNYQLAWSLLEERYSNTREQVYAHLKRLMNMPVIQNESSSAILNLIDITSEVVRSLECLEQEIEGFSSTIFAFILSQKLDQNTKLWWERNLKKETLPTLLELLDFLKDYARTLSATKVQVLPRRNSSKVSSMVSCVTEKHVFICKLCNAEHKLFKCPKFQKLSVKDRIEYVKKQNLCFCCFGSHAVRFCSSNFSCRVCKKKHNSLLCYEREKVSFPQNKTQVEIASPMDRGSVAPVVDASLSSNSPQELNVHAESFVNKNETQCFSTAADVNKNCNTAKKVLLSTAVVLIKGNEGEIFSTRALLDNGSMINLCSSELAEKLHLQKEKVNLSVGCLSGISTTVKSKVNTVIFNAEKAYSRKLDFFVIPKITHLMPSRQIDVCNIVIPNRIKLADPDFYKPGKIQLLLGSEIFFDLLRSGKIYVPNTNLVLQNSTFGYLVSGSIEDSTSETQLVHCGLINDNIDTQLKKFFDLESIGIRDDPNSYDEDKALEIFNETVCFKEGRYVVSLPWKKNREQLGDNYSVAEKRIKNLARRMQCDDTLYLKYREILNEYLDQGIIERVSDSTKPVNMPVFYLPHQAVYRKESVTTKMRIVFDASSHEIGQLSLNDCLWQGINLNPNMFQLLVYFRLNRVAILGDVEKAFLQIVLAEKDRDAVRFLFVKENSTPLQKIDDQLEIYRFKRVLFGVNSSPFLLAATIKLHIQKFKDVYPDAFRILDQCMYVDDLITGADNVLEAIKISSEVKEIMNKANMNLRKWVTNDKCLTRKWEEEHFDIHPLSSNERGLKVLGIQWDIQEDSLCVDTSCLIKPFDKKKNTKRFILQTAGKIYDPLGLITPFTVRIKILLQKIWLQKLEWDAELPPDLNVEWSQWCDEVSQLSSISVPRFVLGGENIEIHVFSDASQKSYGAAVYVRVQNQEQISVKLLASKSRVSPVKKVSLPRLELLGALIAARLGTEVKGVIDRKGSPNIFFWCDSKVTLYWIKGSSKKWKSFVQNRVNEIQRLTNPDSWFYCPTKDNPADLLTRGVSATSLVNNSKWWTCADFLVDPHLPNKCLQPIVPEFEHLTPSEREFYLHEKKSPTDIDGLSERVMLIHENSNILDELLSISNNYYKVINVLSYVFRFIHNCRNQSKIIGPLKVEEVKVAEEKIILHEQRALSCKGIITGVELTNYQNIPSTEELNSQLQVSPVFIGDVPEIRLILPGEVHRQLKELDTSSRQRSNTQQTDQHQRVPTYSFTKTNSSSHGTNNDHRANESPQPHSHKRSNTKKKIPVHSLSGDYSPPRELAALPAFHSKENSATKPIVLQSNYWSGSNSQTSQNGYYPSQGEEFMPVFESMIPWIGKEVNESQQYYTRQVAQNFHHSDNSNVRTKHKTSRQRHHESSKSSSVKKGNSNPSYIINQPFNGHSSNQDYAPTVTDYNDEGRASRSVKSKSQKQKPDCHRKKDNGKSQSPSTESAYSSTSASTIASDEVTVVAEQKSDFYQQPLEEENLTFLFSPSAAQTTPDSFGSVSRRATTNNSPSISSITQGRVIDFEGRFNENFMGSCAPVAVAIGENPFENILEAARAANADAIFDFLNITDDEVNNMLSVEGAQAIFLPSNEAISKMPVAFSEPWRQRPSGFFKNAIAIAPKEKVEPQLTIAQLKNTDRLDSQSGVLFIGKETDDEAMTVNGRRLVRGDVPIKNSDMLLHVVDNLLCPAADRDIIETIRSCAKYDGFLTLVHVTGLIDDLQRDGPFTVFLPSNNALSKIPEDELAVLKENVTALKDFLEYHIVKGTYYSGNLMDGQYLPTIRQGMNMPLRVGVRVDGCQRRLIEVNNSPTLKTDIPTKNGVIHIVDWILRPSDLQWCQDVFLP